MKPWHLHLVAAVLLVVGIGLISVRQLGPAPEVTCLEEGQPTSGFSLERDGKPCPLSVEDFNRYWHWQNKSALPLRWVGLGLAAVAIGTAVTAGVKQVRSRRRMRN
ncbi:hypothetical protein EII34_03220 [Arachnia propionica]|uniref:Uncharacterized protein n=1 Tax=Arachnia propionica TaxID=1750 RepID=A0A3P1TB32_9ACTN|nr:hypothetical protein [Arachnia propionica]MDO5082103.1 hypothetical protein [Arachnia propionica]RRD06651.1 hypothetical protein EII34_03220 [Arachnia propionica]